MAAILDHFSDRLRAGAKADLLALAKVTFIKSRTARVFYDNGFKTVALLANADPKELVPILMQVCYFSLFIRVRRAKCKHRHNRLSCDSSQRMTRITRKSS